jgi:bifunctional DNase/RNase
MLRSLEARVVRVEVQNLKGDVFYGNIIVEIDGRTVEIDSRPSDALAIAVRTHVPILVSREVMDAAGIIPEEDLEDTETVRGEGGDEGEPLSPGGEERLEVFEDFLDKLDIDEDGDDEDPKKSRGKKN